MELSPDSRDQDIYGHTPKTTLGANGLLMIPMISDNIRAIENGFILSFAVNGEHYLVDWLGTDDPDYSDLLLNSPLLFGILIIWMGWVDNITLTADFTVIIFSRYHI